MTQALDLIRQAEGFRAESYRSPAGCWTIGYGTTRGVGPGQRVTPAAAEVLMRQDVDRIAAELEPLVTAPLTPAQWQALLALAYNIGVGAFRASTLRRRINASDAEGVRTEWMRWTKAGRPKRVLPGLVARRRAELAVWESA